MISHKYKCIFIHIPKTAGTSIEFLLDNSISGTTHEPICYYKDSQYLQTYYKFTFVRNPWSRFYSLYNYYKNGGNNKHYKLYHPKYFLYSLKKGFKNYNQITDIDISKAIPNNFDDFCYKFLRDRELFFGRNALNPQTDFITINNRSVVDFIGKFENLKSNIEQIKHRFAIEKKLPHHRKINQKKDYRKTYNSITHDLVETYYKQDINAFGYTFDN